MDFYLLIYLPFDLILRMRDKVDVVFDDGETIIFIIFYLTYVFIFVFFIQLLFSNNIFHLADE